MALLNQYVFIVYDKNSVNNIVYLINASSVKEALIEFAKFNGISYQLLESMKDCTLTNTLIHYYNQMCYNEKIIAIFTKGSHIFGDLTAINEGGDE